VVLTVGMLVVGVLVAAGAGAADVDGAELAAVAGVDG
jgi:hypothetical protein